MMDYESRSLSPRSLSRRRLFHRVSRGTTGVPPQTLAPFSFIASRGARRASPLLRRRNEPPRLPGTPSHGGRHPRASADAVPPRPAHHPHRPRVRPRRARQHRPKRRDGAVQGETVQIHGERRARDPAVFGSIVYPDRRRRRARLRRLHLCGDGGGAERETPSLRPSPRERRGESALMDARDRRASASSCIRRTSSRADAAETPARSFGACRRRTSDKSSSTPCE